jgi:hypothetical protein
MKILRKNDDFKKMPDKSMKDLVQIKNLLQSGWNYCSKEEYKKVFNVKKKEEEKTVKVTKAGKKKIKK